MNSIVLYDLVQDEKEKPSLFKIKEFEVFDNIFDDQYAAFLMSKYIHLGIMDSEHLYIMAINSNYEITGIINVALGNYNNVQVYKRNIILFLALIGAKGFADYHNHPNNSVKVSSDDIVSEAQMDNIAKLLEIEYLGSFILGRTHYIKVSENIRKKIEED